MTVMIEVLAGFTFLKTHATAQEDWKIILGNHHSTCHSFMPRAAPFLLYAD